MARDDGILDLDYPGSMREEPKKYYSTARAKYNPKMKIYYNSDDIVLKAEEILFPGTPDEVTYSQTYWYSDVTNSGIDHVTTIDPWVTV